MTPESGKKKEKEDAKSKRNDREAKKIICDDYKQVKNFNELKKRFPAIAKQMEEEKKRGKGKKTIKYTVTHTVDIK